MADRFDLIGGTSVGGILALAIAARIPMSDVAYAFENDGIHIFSPRPVPQTPWRKKLDLRRSAFKSKYRADDLKRVVSGLVGGDTKIQDLEQRLIIPAVNLTKGGPQVFKTPHHETFVRDRRLTAVDVAMATAAAPTFFPLHAIGGELFADGGLFANSPDQLALHEAEHFLAQDISEVNMISIGTTTSQFSFSNTIKKNMGWIDWMADQHLPKVMIAAQQLITDSVLQHRLNDRYLRIDRLQSPEQERYLALDVATDNAVHDLEALAETSLREAINHPLLKAALKHQAPKQQFLKLAEGANG